MNSSRSFILPLFGLETLRNAIKSIKALYGAPAAKENITIIQSIAALEADSVCVSRCPKIEGRVPSPCEHATASFIMGNDSDFMVFCRDDEGSESTQQKESYLYLQYRDLQFTHDRSGGVSTYVDAFSRYKLSTLLSVPLQALPIIGALVGNDLTKELRSYLSFLPGQGKAKPQTVIRL